MKFDSGTSTERDAMTDIEHKANDGTQLERLVELIEGCVLSKGFTVESRKRVYNDDGIQIAELDIVITGNIGSARFKWLIECRDRPSGGPASGSWIEQLAHRRSRFNFDKVMAVSTTGFSAGAKEEAERNGIDLRLFQNLSYNDVSNWLPPNAPLIIRQGMFNAVRVHLSPPNGSDTTEERVIKFRVDEPRLMNRDSHEKLSIKQLWQKVIADDSFYNDLAPNGPVRTTTISVDGKIRDQYSFDVEGARWDIAEIEFDAVFKVIIPKMPLVQAAQYQSQHPKEQDSETFVQLGRWQGSDDDYIKEIMVFGIPKKRTE